MMSRAHASAASSDLLVFWNSKSSAGSSSRLRSRKSTRSPNLNGRPARGQPSCSSRRYCGMVPTSLMPCAADGGQAEQVPAPDARVLLLLDYRQRSLGLDHGRVGRGDRFRRGVAGRRQLGEGAVPDRRAAVLEEPGERNPMLIGQIQKRSWGGGQGVSGREDRRDRPRTVGRLARLQPPVGATGFQPDSGELRRLGGTPSRCST